MTSNTVEQEIVAKGLTAPRVTPQRIAHVIVGEAFHRLTATLTLCVLTLRNGFTVTGESACASPENFDADIGERIARDDAKRKVWALEGYALRERLAQRSILHHFIGYLSGMVPELNDVELPRLGLLADQYLANGHEPEVVVPVASAIVTSAKERAQLERDQLSARVEGLSRFFSTDKYRELPHAQQIRLDVQHMHMREYLRVLEERLADWVE